MAGLTPQVEGATRRAVLFASLTLDLDMTLILVLALVMVPFLILNGMIFKPFLKLFEARHERVEGAITRANQKLDEAEAKAQQFEEKIKIATRQGLDAREQLRGEANKAMNERIDAERKTVNEKGDKALAEVKTARDSAMATVRSEANRLAEATATKLIGRGA